MGVQHRIGEYQGVALRKESVDRNDKSKKPKTEKRKPLAARRAWIEIQFPFHGFGWEVVALRKESVDRNCFTGMI